MLFKLNIQITASGIRTPEQIKFVEEYVAALIQGSTAKERLAEQITDWTADAFGSKFDQQLFDGELGNEGVTITVVPVDG